MALLTWNLTCNQKYFFAVLQFILFVKCLAHSNILVFGGNGFIGSECVNWLLTKNHNITLLSRGSNYYDFDSKIKPYITHIKCDRYNGLENCSPLKNIAKFDFILDFSAYHPAVIQDTLNYFSEKTFTYIYISSDSVYEVCLPTKKKFSEESDAIRYPDSADQNEMNNRDLYGHHKLEGEEILRDENRASEMQYIILRLPDVIGPRDTTYRWWAYQTFFQFHHVLQKPLFMPSHLQSTSYVYVKDIGRLISKIIEEIENKNFKIVNTVYNIAYPQDITLRQLLDSVQENLKIQGIEYRYNENANYLYPSVYRGPMNVTKAIRFLQWETTTWNEAVEETVTFYKQSFKNFPDEACEMLEKFKLLVTPEDFLLLSKELEQRLNLKCQKEVYEEKKKEEL